jgi:hypothetical protein
MYNFLWKSDRVPALRSFATYIVSLKNAALNAASGLDVITWPSAFSSRLSRGTSRGRSAMTAQFWMVGTRPRVMLRVLENISAQAVVICGSNTCRVGNNSTTPVSGLLEPFHSQPVFVPHSATRVELPSGQPGHVKPTLHLDVVSLDSTARGVASTELLLLVLL